MCCTSTYLNVYSRGHQRGARTRQVARGHRQGQGGGIIVKFLAFFVVLCFERFCTKQNSAARWSQNIWKYLVLQKIRAGCATTHGPVLKITLAWTVS